MPERVRTPGRPDFWLLLFAGFAIFLFALSWLVSRMPAGSLPDDGGGVGMAFFMAVVGCLVSGIPIVSWLFERRRAGAKKH